jgi:ribosomal protein S15P/S13E
MNLVDSFNLRVEKSIERLSDQVALLYKRIELLEEHVDLLEKDANGLKKLFYEDQNEPKRNI